VDYAKNILRALNKLHNKKFVHKDIKPDNLFIDSGNILIVGDMGLCGPYSEQSHKGPRYWSAPEVLMGEIYKTPVDIFSFGLILSYMFSGKVHLRKRDL
jgi:serine/threonine protein kinase